MRFVDVHLRELEVDPDHVQGGMPQESLQGVGIASIAQVLDGEGMAESVWVDVLHAGTRTQGNEHLSQGGAVNCTPH